MFNNINALALSDSVATIETITLIDGQSLTGKVVHYTSGMPVVMVMDKGVITIETAN